MEVLGGYLYWKVLLEFWFGHPKCHFRYPHGGPRSLKQGPLRDSGIWRHEIKIIKICFSLFGWKKLKLDKVHIVLPRELKLDPIRPIWDGIILEYNRKWGSQNKEVDFKLYLSLYLKWKYSPLQVNWLPGRVLCLLKAHSNYTVLPMIGNPGFGM